jgi:hypothetical protein
LIRIPLESRSSDVLSELWLFARFVFAIKAPTFVLIRAMTILRDWLGFSSAASCVARTFVRLGSKPGDELFKLAGSSAALSYDFCGKASIAVNCVRPIYPVLVPGPDGSDGGAGGEAGGDDPGGGDVCGRPPGPCGCDPFFTSPGCTGRVTGIRGPIAPGPRIGLFPGLDPGGRFDRSSAFTFDASRFSRWIASYTSLR